MLHKFITIICLLFVLASPALAQQVWTETEQTSVSLRAGFDMQNITGLDAAGDDLDNSLTPAFNIGVMVEVPLAPNFYLQPGILYNLKGAESNQDFLGEDETNTISLSYLELPVHLLYKPILGNGNLIVGFGPYAAMGIGGEVENDNESRDVEFQNTVDENDPNDVVYFKRLDAGANFIVGYEFANRLSIQLNAQLGLTEISPEIENSPNSEASLKNTGFGVSFGYRF